MKILTCNIRCFGAPDGENNWIHRKDLCAQVIQSRAPDIICFQEMWEEQLADLTAAFPEHQTYGMTDLPQGRHPTNSIFFRRDAFALISCGGYWLSNQPHVAGSHSWGSACVRLANWIRLRERTTAVEFRVINTHLDHVGQEARENQAKLIVEDASAYARNYAQILTGDMNCDSSNPAIDTFKAAGWVDTYGQVHDTEDPGHTRHSFLGPKHASVIGKMDWIFTRGPVKVQDAEVITDSHQGRFPSDHYFVGATLSLPEPDAL